VPVRLAGARLLVGLLLLCDLKPVPEDRRDHAGRTLARYAHESQMPVVDVAHGGHAGHPRLLLQALAQLLYAADDFHEDEGLELTG
jgi:hypothetical protein